MSTPQIQLQTLFVLNGEGRITATREPGARRGPAFALIRGKESCAWAVGAGVSSRTALELEHLAREEPPVVDFRDEPVHAERYSSLVGGRVETGPAFTFPDRVAKPAGVESIDDIRLLDPHFPGWTGHELFGRAPMVATLEGGHAISICF